MAYGRDRHSARIFAGRIRLRALCSHCYGFDEGNAALRRQYQPRRTCCQGCGDHARRAQVGFEGPEPPAFAQGGQQRLAGSHQSAGEGADQRQAGL